LNQGADHDLSVATINKPKAAVEEDSEAATNEGDSEEASEE
jgi:hypothetical protein